MSQAAQYSVVLQLAERCGGSWPTLLAAAGAAPKERDRLSELLAVKQLQPSDTGAVVFGSLARDEWTSKSDLGWTLLIDGPVKAETHRNRTQDGSRARRPGSKARPHRRLWRTDLQPRPGSLHRRRRRQQHEHDASHPPAPRVAEPRQRYRSPARVARALITLRRRRSSLPSSDGILRPQILAQRLRPLLAHDDRRLRAEASRARDEVGVAQRQAAPPASSSSPPVSGRA